MDTTATANATCQISPHARAVRAVLTGFIGSAMGGLTGGFYVALFSGWISWFATLHIVLGGLELLLSVLSGHKKRRTNILSRIVGSRIYSVIYPNDDDHESDTNVLGWIGWIYSAIYSPVSQALWVIGNLHSASAELMIVQALSICTTALPLTIDPKARYGNQLGEGFSSTVFNFVTAMSTLILGGLSSVLLVSAAKELHHHHFIVIIYIIMLVVWTAFGRMFRPDPTSDKTNSPTGLGVLAGLAMGCFAGILIATPAFCVMMIAPKSPGLGLMDYVQCEGLALWRRVIAVIP
ncbi:hypothetical protein EDB19DRAFT_1171964 [Suillus lakei]|nr:hypothetical protein EDB19DRAFT_1171964 [Suillus lakei]